MRWKVFLSSIAISNLALADGNLYILPQYSYGINVLDSNIMPVSNVNLGMLYQFESSALLIGGRVGYTSGTSDNYYIPQNGTHFNRSMSSTYFAFSVGGGVNLSKSFRNNVLLNVQYAPTGSYGISCSDPSQFCQTQLGKTFHSFGFGLENQIFYNLSSDFALGVTSGVMFNFAQLSNYSSVSGVTYNTTQTSSSTAPYIGFIMSYKAF